MNGHDKGRRYLLYKINERHIIEAFRNWSGRDVVSLPVLKDLPEGYEIHGVQYDAMYEGMAFLIWHPSFPKVPIGQYIPLAGVTLNMEAIELRRADLPQLRDPTREDMQREIERLADKLGVVVAMRPKGAPLA